MQIDVTDDIKSGDTVVKQDHHIMQKIYFLAKFVEKLIIFFGSREYKN